jgi:glucose-6-phosphate isomerase
MQYAMTFETGLEICWNEAERAFAYGPGVFGPAPEHRSLDAIRASLHNPDCEGPDPVYSIVMDVGRVEHFTELQHRMLLFGVVKYAAGRLGKEPVRSQGHIHAMSPHSGWSAPELFEIWEGRAIVYAQQHADNDPGTCMAIEANPGDHVVVPPGWAHCVINADPNSSMVFAACCDRQYGFEYDKVRAHGGLAWFPFFDKEEKIRWQPNPRYSNSQLSINQAHDYAELNLIGSKSIYQRFAENPYSLQWISEPSKHDSLWSSFVP